MKFRIIYKNEYLILQRKKWHGWSYVAKEYCVNSDSFGSNFKILHGIAETLKVVNQEFEV